KGLIDVDAVSRCFSRMQVSVLERIRVRKYGVGFGRVPHVLLDTEIVYPEIKMQGCPHANGRKIRGAMRAGAHVVELGELRDAAQVGDATGVHHRRPDEVDELLGDQCLTVVNGVEYLADGDGRNGVLANDTKAF